MSESSEPTAVHVVPSIIAFGVTGIMSFGFGAGYGSRTFATSAAYKELIEKFPEKPTAEAEALARTGAGRALMLGTALAGVMGVGAVLFARSNGIQTAADLGDEIQKWLPTKSQLEARAAHPPSRPRTPLRMHTMHRMHTPA